MICFQSVIVILLICIVCVFRCEISPNITKNNEILDSNLIFSTVIFRHGDRTPIKTYPLDPNTNFSLWHELGWGQLTKRGKAQHFALGQWLRARYQNFLPADYHASDVYIRSTDVDRTIMSALSILAGLFPPTTDEIWSNVIKDWQPIPVHTEPESEDNVLAGKKLCPKYDETMKQVTASPPFSTYDQINAKLYEYISENSGLKIRSLVDMEYFYDTLYIEDQYNLTLPQWTRQIYPEKLHEMAVIAFQIQCYTRALQRLKIGLLFNEIVTRMFDKIHNRLQPNRKLWMYSGHDVTIANVLMTLGVFNHQCPPYASAILIELRERDGTYGVSVYLKNDSNTTPYPLTIPNCDLFCDLNQFRDILMPVLIDEKQWEQECQPNFFEEHETAILGISFVASAVFIVTLVIVVTILAYKNLPKTDLAYFRLDVNEYDS